MVVITISYPSHQSRFSYPHSPTLTDGSNSSAELLQISADGDTLAATKQEEWVKKKRVELTTTKQIETRVKRQIVLEDGKVVDDSGPIVTTNTTEDTDKQESEHTEHFTQGDDLEGKEGWVAVESVPEEAVVKETNERKVTTHDEVEDIYETEEIQHLGDVSNEEIIRALREEQDVRKGLLSASEQRELLPFYRKKEPEKRVLQQTRRHDRTTDIEDTKEVSRRKDDGNLVTEITRRHEHEVFHNDDIPDSDSEDYEVYEHQEGEHDYSHSKTQNYIDYVIHPTGKYAQKVGEGPRYSTENISSQRQGDEEVWDSVSERFRVRASEGLFSTPPPPKVPPTRPNVLTQRTMDLGTDEVTKKAETNRWLNSHFGSSSSSLNSGEGSPSGGIHVTLTTRSSPQPKGNNKRISFGKPQVHFDLKRDGRHSASSGRMSMSKSGSPWDDAPTPTPPPRFRRTKSPEFSHFDYKNMQGRNYTPTSDYTSSSYLQKREDLGERKSYERREQNIGYVGPNSPDYNNYLTKESSYYKTNETDNPAINGEADVESRKTVERKERVFNYEGPPQRQFQPKYILGTPSSTMGRLKGIEKIDPSQTSQTLPRKKFYFGDDQGSLLSSTKDHFDVSISNNYSNTERGNKGLSRSMSFTPTRSSKRSPLASSNPHIPAAPDLLAPKLLQNMSRSRSQRDVRGYNSQSPGPGPATPSRRSFFGEGEEDYQETYRMSSATPDHEEGRPKISTDTTSRFSRRTLRNEMGEPTGQVQSTDTKTRTKSKYTASEVLYPSGRRVASPTPIEAHPPLRKMGSGGGTVVIPVRDHGFSRK